MFRYKGLNFVFGKFMKKYFIVPLLFIMLSQSMMQGQVVINEVMINAGNCDGSCVPNTGEWTELYNHSPNPIDLSCYVLTDGDWAATIPQGTILGPYEFYVIGSNNSAAAVDLNIGNCNCTSIGNNGDGNIGVFTNGDEQLVLANSTGNITDGVYWGAGQFSQTPSIITTASVGCPSTTINLSANNPEITSISGGGADETTIALDCDGAGNWDISVTPSTPGSTNVNPIVLNDNATIVAQSCSALGSITLNPSGGIGPYNFQWQATLAGNVSNSAVDLNAGNYSVIITDGGQCAPPQIFSFTVPLSTTPSLTINATDIALCEGESTTIIATGGNNYVWNASPDLNTSSGDIVIATPTSTSTYTVQSNNNGCNETQSITIQVDSPPAVVINNNSPICVGENLQLNTNNINGADFQWTGPNGYTSLAPNPVITNSTLNIQGNYHLDITLGACSVSATTNVIVTAPISTNITNVGPFCINDSAIDLMADTEPGTWDGVGITNTLDGVFDPSVAGPGNHNVTFNSDSYCTASASINLVVESMSDASISPISSLCTNDADIVLVTAQMGGMWTGSGVGWNGIVSPSQLGPGSYDAIYTIGGQCGDTDNITFTVWNSPTSEIIGDSAFGCTPVAIAFSHSQIAPGDVCQWQIDGATISTDCAQFDYLVSEPGCHQIGLIITNSAGCTSMTEIPNLVCVDGTPNAAFEWTPLTPTLSNNVMTFQNLSSNTAYQQWNINGTMSEESIVSYTVPASVTDPFLACISVSGTYGCQDSICYTIEVDNEFFVYIPNSFTPNNDEINNGFGPSIYGIEADEMIYDFSIFSRNGDCIFKSNDPLQKWTGNIHEGEYYGMSDVYEWQLRISPKWEAEVSLYRGYVLLLR